MARKKENMGESESLTPYRSAAIIPIEEGPAKGLILAAKPIKPHKCNPPGYWKRVFYSLTFRKIYLGTLWRCECGGIFEWSIKYYSGRSPGDRYVANWTESDLKAWLAKGGVK